MHSGEPWVLWSRITALLPPQRQAILSRQENPAEFRQRALDLISAADDRVDRQFHRDHPNPLLGHRYHRASNPEGMVCCAVVLNAWSRLVVGCSNDAKRSTALVANALGMAIELRRPNGDTVTHGDQGTRPSFKWSSQHRSLLTRKTVTH